MLLGGGSKRTDNGKTVHQVWTRGATEKVAAGSRADHGLIDANMALDDIYAWSDWYRNGEKLASPRTTGLTGGYDTLSMALWPADGPDGHKSWSKASADGLAFHGSELDGQDWRQCRGNQRLGELIIYGRYLTEAEQIATEAYLSSKWGLSQKCHTNSAAVVLAEGARLVCENGSQFVGSVSGPGTVEGSVTVRRFVADGASGGFTVAGTLTVAPSPVFEVRNAVCEKYPEDIAVCSADAFADAENLQEAVLSGVPDCCRAKVMIAGGTLYVRLRARGTVMIVR
jgi:hypothetical protein